MENDEVIEALLNNLPDRSLKGKVILDIGGLPGHQSDRLFELGAAEIHGINLYLPENSKNFLTENYFHHICDARNIGEEVPLADAAVGFNVLEHLPDLKNIINGVFVKLKSGAPLVMHGGPLWSSCMGHHCYVHCDDRQYLFAQPSNPIDNWDHLLLSPEEHESKLIDKGIPKDHVSAIISQIYFEDEVNRLSSSELKEIFLSHGQRSIGFMSYTWSTPNYQLFSSINSKYSKTYSLEDFMTGAMIAVSMKW